MLCGVCWLADGIAVNTHQLKRLVTKCKSSIYGSLQKIGYTVSLGRAESAQAMTAFFPMLKDNTAELRKWTVRRREDGLDYPSPGCRVKLQKPRPGVFEIPLEGLCRSKSAPPPSCTTGEMEEIHVPGIFGTELPLVMGRFPEVLNDDWGVPSDGYDLHCCYDDEMSFCHAGID
jgi:hypothetical protein